MKDLSIHKGIAAILLLLTLVSCDRPSSRMPNVVIILSDDQGWGDLSIHGNANLATPNIDRLAREGVMLDRFFVSPVCSPTRAEMLTGRYHVRGGVYSTSAGGERLDLDETTLAEAFRKAGYATAAYGKWHNGMQPPYHPNARGFDDFYGFCSGHWGNYFSPMLEHNGELVTGEGYIIDDLTDHGIRFMEENKDRPFLLYLPYNTPHSPMQVPDQWWEKFKDSDLALRHRDPEREDIPFTRAALAMCENIDWNVGRIMDKVTELGLSEETILIYFSDNGPNSWRWNEGMKGRKGSTDEGGVRSPMFIRWDGTLMSGRKIEEITGAIDLFPTLMDLCGIPHEPRKPFDGKSIAPLLTMEDPEWEDRFIISYWNDRVSVRSQQYRLDHEERLFDITADPGQYADVSADHPGIYRAHLQAREEWVENALKELKSAEERPFTLGHPDFPLTQMPARDAVFTGDIERSNRYPNNSFLRNWTSTSDRIIWDVEVLEPGEYEVEIYYTCPEESVGATIALEFMDSRLTGVIRKPHDPPLEGMEKDRVPRVESYVKDFTSMSPGTFYLPAGRGELTLRALEVPGKEVMDFRLMMFRRVMDE